MKVKDDSIPLTRFENTMKKAIVSRRSFLASLAPVAVALPQIVSFPLKGRCAPSNILRVGCIGVGRMGMVDLKDFMRFSDVRISAVCDVDSKRAENAARFVNQKYKDQSCRIYGDYRELLASGIVDLVSIVTPDHWHGLIAIAAAKAGNDIFLQKPLTHSIHEGRVLSDTVTANGRILQVGSQQRSDREFRHACELVRNGRIGAIKEIRVGFGIDPAGDVEPEMPVPDNLDYNFWLGPAPTAPYTEKRVHPQNDYGRPGWLRIQDYCHGMITGWGSHHMDIAQWGMDTVLTGPKIIEGKTTFPTRGIWDVHGPFQIEYQYANGIKVICADNEKNKQGIEFIGSQGRVYVRRGYIETEPESLLTTPFTAADTRLYYSGDHKGNFVECVRSRRQPIVPVEEGHRSNTVCVLGAISMKLGRKLEWDPVKERIVNDSEADAMLKWKIREPWNVS